MSVIEMMAAKESLQVLFIVNGSSSFLRSSVVVVVVKMLRRGVGMDSKWVSWLVIVVVVPKLRDIITPIECLNMEAFCRMQRG